MVMPLKKAILISCFNWYDDRLRPLRKLLESKGYDVRVVLSDFDHTTKKRVIPTDSSCEYIHTPAYRKNLSLGRITSHVYFALSVRKLLASTEPDLIYLLVPPNLTAKFCADYKRRNKHTKFVIDLIDLWPESFPIQKLKNNPVFSVWKELRNNAMKHSDLIITECAMYRAKLEKLFTDKKSGTLYLFRNQSERTRTVVLAHMHSDRESHKNSRNISIGYVGSINNIIDIEKICCIIAKIREAGFEVTIHIIGDGESRREFITSAKKTGADVIYHGIVFDAEKKARILGRCDFGLNIMKHGLSVGLTIKSVDYLSKGIPIISNIKGDTWEIVRSRQIGINYTGEPNRLVWDLLRTDWNKLSANAYVCYTEMFTEKAFKASANRYLSQIGI